MDFSQWLLGEGASERTIAAYTSDVSQFGAWHEARHGAALTPETLTRWDVNEWKAELREQGYANSTLNRKVEALRAYGRFGSEQGALPAQYDPLAKVRREKLPALGPQNLDRAEQGRVFRALDLLRNGARTSFEKQIAARDYAAVLLMRYAGLRVAELCALTLGDVQLSERKGCIYVRDGKGHKPRTIPLNSGEAREAVQEWLTVRPQATSDRLFIGKRGEPIETRAIERRIEALGQMAGVDFTPHTLRHTFAHEYLASGNTLTELRVLLGHESIDTTRQYTEPDEHELRRGIERMA